MSKKFIAQVVQDSAEISAVAAHRVATDLIEAIVKEMKKEGGFTLPSFGTFRVAKTKARKGHPFQGLLAWARTRAVATCSRATAAST